MPQTAQSAVEQWFASIGTAPDYKTMHFWAGSGQSTFDINFAGGYISSEHVKCFIREDSTGRTSDVSLTFVTASRVTTPNPVPAGWTICIYRDTPKNAPLALFVDGAIMNAVNLDRNAKQSVFAVAEMLDRFDSTNAMADEAIERASQAMVASKAAQVSAEQSAIYAGVAQGAATSSQGYASAAQAAASQAGIDAARAVYVAEAIDGKASQAMSDAASALSIAGGIDSKATQALSKSQEAGETAGIADAKATSAVALRTDIAAPDGITHIGEGTYAYIRTYSGQATKIKCLGRSNVFDRAEGVFYRDTRDSTSLDDDGTILVDALGRRWKRQFLDWVTPTWWGASGVDDDSDCVLAFEAAARKSRYVRILPGTYGFSRAWVISRERMHVVGSGTLGVYGTAAPIGGPGGTELKALATFTSSTVAGSSGKAVIWYGKDSGSWNDTSWIDGGLFEGFSISCMSLGVEGIRINRVCNSHSFRDITISNPSIGINGTHFGWLTKFDNVYVYQALVSAIRLTGAYNGCTFTGCGLYGGNVSTEVLLDIANDCFGNSWTGGFIEGGGIAVRIKASQISFNGTDFEAISRLFFKVEGLFVGSSLAFANPPVVATGCTFVGVPSLGGIEVNGGLFKVTGCFFINNGPLPPDGVYCLNGILGADTTPGFESQCISECDNTWRGWGNQIATGSVFSRFKKISTEGIIFPAAQIHSPNPTTLDDYREGNFTPALAGTGWGTDMVAAGRYTKIGNLVNVFITITGATNSSTITSSFLSGLPFAVETTSSANVCSSYNVPYGVTAVVPTGDGGIIYMPDVATTPASLIITAAYQTN